MTPREIMTRLEDENCFHNNKLMVYPEWFTKDEMFAVINAGLMVNKFYKNLFNHSDMIRIK